MANNINKSSLIYVMLLTFLPTLAISSSHPENGLKSMKLTLYQHDIFNKNNIEILTGVTLGSNSSQTAAPFGTLTVLANNLTLTPDPSSKVLGNAEAMTAVSSFDGLEGLLIIRYALGLEEGLTGTISALGAIQTYKPSDVPITGGTGDFLLVQGYITTSVESIEGLTLIYKIDFNLFWPPYAPHANKV